MKCLVCDNEIPGVIYCRSRIMKYNCEACRMEYVLTGYEKYRVEDNLIMYKNKKGYFRLHKLKEIP